MRFCEQQRFGTFTRVLLAAVLTGTVAAGGAVPALAGGSAEQQQLVDKSKMTLEGLLADPSTGPALRALRQETKAIYIVPQFVRGAFVFGGAGGSGVLLVRDEATKKWSEPAFYNIGSASFGLQAGGDVSEMIFVVVTQKGLEQFYRNEFKLGLDAGMAIGPVGEGGGVKGITADLLGYAKKKGAFVGMSVDGSVIAVSDASNEAYYGKPVRPTDIVVKHAVSNPKSADLRNAAAKF
ncbi:MAG: lipid-binding SYLF domain-containing protein [Nitrospira sp.]|nr:lipid-binding SYLF domain-containing protein [Nitrospira sp.]